MTAARTLVADADWRLCRDIARENGRSFYLASRLLGRERRRAMHAAYAFCRIADDIVDRTDGGQGRAVLALDAWERQIVEPEHPVARAFFDCRQRYGIPTEPVHELFDGMRADLEFSRFESWQQLRHYCYLAAGTVGLIVAPVLGCADTRALPRAAELGIAMQLTNILRDVGEDGRMGRLYLPLDELDRFGVRPDQLLAGAPGHGFSLLMAFQIDRARMLYRHALTAVPALSAAGRMTTMLAAQLYASILDEIERNEFDVLRQRVVVPRLAKGLTLGSTAARFAWLQIGGSGSVISTAAPGPLLPPGESGGVR